MNEMPVPSDPHGLDVYKKPLIALGVLAALGLIAAAVYWFAAPREAVEPEVEAPPDLSNSTRNPADELSEANPFKSESTNPFSSYTNPFE